MSGSCRSSRTTSGSRGRDPDERFLARGRGGDVEAEARQLPGHHVAERRRRRRRAGREAAGFMRRRPPLERRSRPAAAGSRRSSPARRALDHDVAAPAADEVQRQEQTETGAALSQAEERLEDALAGARPRCRTRRRVTRMRTARLGSASRVDAGRPGWQAWTALSSRLISACCSSASSARTWRPGGERLHVDPHRSGRARSARSAARRRATAARGRRCRRRGLAARHAQEVLGDAAAAQDLLARDRGVLADASPRPGRLSCGARVAQDALHARQHGGERRVQLVREAGGEHARARPAGATRPAAPRPRAARRCRARPRRRAAARPEAPGSATCGPPPRRPRRPACAARRCAPAARRTAGRRASGSRHAAQRRARRRGSSSPSTSLAGVPGPAQERVVGRDDLPLRVEHDDAVVDAVDDGLEPLALAADLADQAGHRVGHRVELAREPGDGVGALGRARAGRGRRRRSGARSSRSAAAGAARTRGRRARSARPASSVERAAAGDHPAQVAVHRRRGSRRRRRSRIRMPLIRWPGSWQRWHASRLRNGHHRAQHRAAARLDDPARVRAVRAGSGGRPGRSASRMSRSLPGSRRARSSSGRALAVEQHDVARRAAACRSSRSSARSGCGRSPSSGARAPRGSARPARARSPRSLSSSVWKWWRE